MVRLKGELPISCLINSLFQFQYGTIKRYIASKTAKDNPHFNSSMVRLKGDGEGVVECSEWFQFQYGTIKSFVFRIISY